MITLHYKEHRIYAQCCPARDQLGLFTPLAIIRGQLQYDDDEPIFSERRCETPDQAESVAVVKAISGIDDHRPRLPPPRE